MGKIIIKGMLIFLVGMAISAYIMVHSVNTESRMHKIKAQPTCHADNPCQ